MSYPIKCKTKDSVQRAARKRGGAVHQAKDIGALPDGGSSPKHAGKVNRGSDGSVHGKPVMAASSGDGKDAKGHRASPKG